MSAQPEPLGVLFPGALPPQREQVSKLKYKRRYIPKTYTPAEVDAAKRVIAHWNSKFAGVSGAYRANPGDACNIKAFVRMLRRCEKSEGLFDIGEKQACRAITGYRQDPNNNKLGRWKRFRDWMTAESIDFYVGREVVKTHRREQPKTVSRAVDQTTAAAARIVRHKKLVDLAVLASRTNLTPRQVVHEYVQGGVEEAKALPPILDRWEALASADREALSNRARKVFAAYFHRPPGKDRHDPARLDGIALALLDLDTRKGAAHA